MTDTLHPQPDANGWYTIDSAPRDGTVVDLWSARGIRYVDAVWDIFGDGYCCWTDANHHGQIEDAGPFTHWKPLGPPPVGVDSAE